MWDASVTMPWFDAPKSSPTGTRYATRSSGSEHTDRRRGENHDVLHVRVPLRYPRASEGRPRPLHRRQSEASGQSGRDLREGLGRDHAALLAGATFQTLA